MIDRWKIWQSLLPHASQNGWSDQILDLFARLSVHAPNSLSWKKTYKKSVPIDLHTQVSLLILSCLSFPFQVESDFSARKTHLNHVRALIIRLCKHHGLVVSYAWRLPRPLECLFIRLLGSRHVHHVRAVYQFRWLTRDIRQWLYRSYDTPNR